MFSQANLFQMRPSSCVLLSIILVCSLPLVASSPGDFTVVVLPDPQNYSQYNPGIFDAQTQWIAANAVAQNIQVVLDVGDTIGNAMDSTEWQNANQSIAILDQSEVPYAIAIGNHDYDTSPPTNRQATYFNQYFGPSRYLGKPYYGPSSFPASSNENFYETFSWGGESLSHPDAGVCSTEQCRRVGQVCTQCQFRQRGHCCHPQLPLFRWHDRRSM